MDKADLHLVRLVLNRREVLRVASRHRLPPGVDDGAILHAALAQLFAHSVERAVVPLHNFAVDDSIARVRNRPDLLFLLGYASLEADQLVNLMGPARTRLLVECQSRVMPPLPAGLRAGFRVRVCPVVRTRRFGDRERPVDRQGKPRPVEVDAWLAHRHTSGGFPPDGSDMPFAHSAKVWAEREQVYGDLLTRELAREGGVVVEEGPRLVAFQRTLMRRGGGTRQLIERPDATMEGVLRVVDPGQFWARLRRGIGRHRAFGFGTLLLRAPRMSPGKD